MAWRLLVSMMGLASKTLSVAMICTSTGKISLERERLEEERKERERRFGLESQERQVILDLLKEKILKGWRGRETPEELHNNTRLSPQQ